MRRAVVQLVTLLTSVIAGAAADRPPNVVLFLVDDLGWSDLGCFGSTFHETPAIDAFAERSVRFTQAYAACHVCSPSRAAILTGRYPARLQLTDWLPGRRNFDFQKLLNAPTRQQLALEEQTLAEFLHRAGYRTAHIGKWHLGEEPFGPLAQGFDVQLPRWNKGWPKAGYHAPFELDGLDDSPGDYLTDRLTDEAVRFIEQSREGPFFLYLSHFAVHDPIEGRDDLVRKYDAKRNTLTVAPEDDPFVLEGNPDGGPFHTAGELRSLLSSRLFRQHRVLPDRLVRVKQQQDNIRFAAMVESMDQSFERVLHLLTTLGLEQNTIVVLTSDNGGMSAANFGNPDRVIPPDRLDAAYATSNLPLRAGKGWLYEGGIRVPLLIRWPGRSVPGVCDTPVTGTDLLPTILEMTGSETSVDAACDGVSLVPLLRRTGSLDRESLFWHFPHYSNHGMQSPGGAIRRGDEKLIEYFEHGTVQLFNLRDDPGEQHDLSQEEPARAEQLRALLHEWRTSVDASMMEPNPRFAGAATIGRPAAGDAAK